MNENLKPIKELTPFTKMIMSIGTLPSSFYASMSYYESMVWLYEYLKNEIIPTINNNGEAVEELQELYVELKNYIDEYFTDLNVQEQINNKLDEMAEDGTLQEIVASYLQTKAIFGFDSVSQMKLSTNLINGSFARTLGYYSKNDGGESLYKIRTITNDDIVDEMSIIALNDDSLIAELIIQNNQLNIAQFGCIGDSETNNTSKLQAAFNYCCDNNYVLYIPNKRYLVNDSINIKSSINVKGDSNSSYKATSEILCDFGDENTSLFVCTSNETNTPPRCTFENIKIQRERTQTDGYPTDLYAYGKSGKCFDFYSNESVFNRIVVIGFGTIFTKAIITTCQECDFIYCNSIIKTNSIVTAFNIVNCNLYANGLLFDINHSIQNLNISDSWIEDFISLLKNYHKPIQNFNVVNSTLTNTAKGQNYLVYDESSAFSRQFINFVNCVLYVKQNFCDGAPSSTEFEMRLINSTILYGGSGETINIVGNSKFLNLSSQNIDSLNTKGFDFSNNQAYNPIKLAISSTLPDRIEGEVYYNNNNNGKRIEYFNNSLHRNIIPPVVINPNADGTKPSFTPTCLTIAINQLLFAGDLMGWVFHPTTNDWVTLPQIGQRTYTTDPTNLFTPKRLGEMIFDTGHNEWYISTGTTSADWKKIT